MNGLEIIILEGIFKNIFQFLTLFSIRLSFIGHSLGGLIIRAALPYLECYSSKMHLFMTFSSAHLGYMNSSKLIETGIFTLNKQKTPKNFP